ncbi:galactose oxidase-like domain-containing protein [Methylobacterium gossipiicola]|uniref:galactose oxidase-like domain-containing protein n=1 Tax=Methylobacterium gossipiicola TaxID=582675 RepID=UPI001FCDBB91|nr:galactose oxidase-like domain-containing protein [Methylobacterium gossipiicola]
MAAAQLPVVVATTADPLLDGLAIPDDAPTRGMWSASKPWPIISVTTVMLPTGKIATFGSPQGNGVQDGRTFAVWDPAKGFSADSQAILPGIAGVNSFCGAQAFRPDGSVLVSGGIFDNGSDKGSVLINPAANAIGTVSAKLANDRYYSTMVTKADGNPIIVGGSYPYQGGHADPQGSIDKGLMTGMTPEVFENGAWRSLFGAKSRDAFGPDNNRFWYPRAWVAPNGKIFGVSSDKMWYLDPANSGSVTAMPFRDPQRDATVAAQAPNTGPNSTAVMYDIGKIIQVGGNSFDNGSQMLASSRATTIDINGATPILADTATMTYGRSWANATVLPTGKVVVMGGSLFGDQADNNKVLATETWDPATGRWTVGASNAIYRGYHSSASLMQNGAILTSGGGIPGPVNNFNAEIYYPPYLFTTVNGKAALAPRPQIVSLSANKLSHAQSMRVELAGADGVAQVVLLGLAQVTHSFDSGQRRIPVTFTQAGTLLTVQTPATTGIAPPGYYQLVAIDAKGVPSAGVIVALGANVAAPVGQPSIPVGGNWVNCATENGTCTVANGPKTVRYGVNGQYVTKQVTGSIACSNAAFGNDPVYGATKYCDVLAASTGGSGMSGGGSGSTPGQGAGGSGTGTGGSMSANSPVSTPSTSTWNSFGIAASKIATGADGTTVTINKDNNTVWLYVADNNWRQLPGQMRDVAVVGANRIYGIGLDAVVYRFDGTQWSAVPSANNVSIGAASDGTIVVVNQNKEVWLKPTDDLQGNWRRVPGSAQKVVPMNGKSLWAVGLDNNVYRSDGTNGWVYVGNTISDIAASSDGSVLVINRNTGAVWRKVGDNTTEAWSMIPNSNGVAIAAPNAQRAILIGRDANIYRW